MAKQALALVIALTVSLPAMGDVVVNWNKSNYVARADSPLQGGSPTNPSGNIQNWNPVGPVISSTIDSNYSNQPLYGVFQTQDDITPIVHETYQIEGDAGNSDLHGQLWYGVRGDGDENVTGLFSFKSGDFLNGGVGTGDTINMAMLNVEQLRGDGFASVRRALKSAGNWYLSDDNLTGEGDDLVLNYTGGNWANFTPSNSSTTSLMTGEGLTYNIAGSTLNNIEEVGFFFAGQTVGTARARIRLDSFVVSAIPEPTSLTVFGLGAIGMLLRRRR